MVDLDENLDGNFDGVDHADSAQSAEQAKEETPPPAAPAAPVDVPPVAAAQAPAVIVKQPAKEAKAIDLDDQGLMSPKDSAEEWRIADLMLKSRALPKQFENVAQVIMAMQFLKAHNLPPMIAIRQTTIINGTLSIWGDLPKALVDRSGLMEDFEEILFDKEYTPISYQNKNLHHVVWGAACVTKRKDKPAITRSFTMDEAKIAGVLDKTSSVWKSYPRRMIQMRARSIALKDAFPDVLSGISINEYDHNMLGGDEDLSQLSTDSARPMLTSIADEMNEVANEKAEESPKSEPAQ